MSDLSDGLKQGWYDSRPRGKDLEDDFKINTNRAYRGALQGGHEEVSMSQLLSRVVIV